MKYTSIVLVFAITLACTIGSVSESNLIGNTYSIRMELDRAGNEVTSGILGTTTMEFTFKGGHEGVYRVGAGDLNNEIPIKWSLENDSISIEQLNQATPRLDQYAISKIENGGYSLRNSRSQFNLIKK